MAFDESKMIPVIPAIRGGGSNIWSYQTTDAIATVIASGYFDNGSTTNTGMRDKMEVNDIIMCVSSTGGTPSLDILHVGSITSGVIAMAATDINDA